MRCTATDRANNSRDTQFDLDVRPLPVFKVANPELVRARSLIRAIIVTFTEDVDRVQAEDPRNYRLIRMRNRRELEVPLMSAVYAAASRSVRLRGRGLMDFVRASSEVAPQLGFSGTVPGRSILTGRVRRRGKGDGKTLLLLLNPTAVTVRLPAKFQFGGGTIAAAVDAVLESNPMPQSLSLESLLDF